MNVNKRFSSAEISDMLMEALRESVGESFRDIDFSAPLQDAGLDSLRLSSTFLSFEAKLGAEIPIECIDELAEADSLAEMLGTLEKYFADSKAA
jgi:acyl carrier protein